MPMPPSLRIRCAYWSSARAVCFSARPVPFQTLSFLKAYSEGLLLSKQKVSTADYSNQGQGVACAWEASKHLFSEQQGLLSPCQQLSGQSQAAAPRTPPPCEPCCS